MIRLSSVLFFVFLAFAQSIQAAVIVPGGGGGSSAGGSATNLGTILNNIQVTGAITNLGPPTVLYVSTNGNNSAAHRGRIDKPFREPRAAKDAAVAGDLVIVQD